MSLERVAPLTEGSLPRRRPDTTPIREAGSRKATLVERFLEFNHWPTSRKTFWLLAIAFPFHALLMPALFFSVAPLKVVDLRILGTTLFAGALVDFLAIATGWVLYRSGREGRWTAYMVVILYGSFLAVLIDALGLWSTAMISWATSVAILVAIWYDTAIGWFAFIFTASALALLSALTVLGVLPYAPAVMNRTLDSQASLGWMAANSVPVLAGFGYSFVLCILIVAARTLQDARLQKAQALISRYIPSQLAEKIIKGEHSDFFRPERAKLTIVFSDIEGFTQTSDHLDPEDFAALINEYLSEMVTIAERHGATIDHIVGDGIMIIFGAPFATTDKDHALRALRMALEMQQRVAELGDLWLERGIDKPFRMRVGINTGHASVGDYGSPGRKLYSAMGVQTNLAARIQAHCEPGKVLISHSTRALVHDEFACLDRGQLDFKGCVIRCESTRSVRRWANWPSCGDRDDSEVISHQPSNATTCKPGHKRLQFDVAARDDADDRAIPADLPRHWLSGPTKHWPAF